MKKEKFKNLVYKKIKHLSKEYLITLRSKHSKSANLMHRNVLKDYLKTEQITTDEKKLLFALKTRQVDVKTNFRNMYSNMLCRLCTKVGTEESEIHMMTCEKIISDIYLKTQLENISYADIFGTLERQVVAVKVWKKVIKVWKLKLEAEKLSPSGHQAHQPQGQSASYACTSTQTVDFSSPANSNCTVYDFG